MPNKAIIYLITALCFVLALAACEVDAIYPQIKLHPPLGLTAELYDVITNGNTNRTIMLQFWGYNSENYFNGYNIYTADNMTDLTNPDSLSLIGTASTSYRFYTNTEGLTNEPTIPDQMMTEPRLYSYIISNDTDGSALSNGKTYYYNVRAYGWHQATGQKVYSYPSNPVYIWFNTN